MSAKRVKTQNRLAWVSGTKPNDYALRVVIIDSTSEFHALDTMSFTKYRAAQDIANAINAYLEAQS